MLIELTATREGRSIWPTLADSTAHSKQGNRRGHFFVVFGTFNVTYPAEMRNDLIRITVCTRIPSDDPQHELQR